MLETLQLHNVILVKNMEISFNSGFNVITGETGAGKSLVIKSLAILSGQQPSDTVILAGEESAFIEATFVVTQSHPDVDPFVEDGRLVVSRRLFRSKPTVNKLNYESVSLKTLKAVMAHLIFVSSQHQVMALMSPVNHMKIFDTYLDAAGRQLLMAYQSAYGRYTALATEAAAYEEQRAHLMRDYQSLCELVADVEERGFGVGEEDALHDQQKQCDALQDRSKWVDMVQNLADTACDTLSKMGDALQNLTDITGQSRSINVPIMIEELRSLQQDMGQDSLDIQYLETVDGDAINRRLHDMFTLKIKYKEASVDALLERVASAKVKIANYDRQFEANSGIMAALEDAKAQAVDLANQLSKKRQAVRQSVEFVMVNELKQLGMMDAQFCVAFSASELTPRGCDAVEFLFTGNPTMPPLPLQKVASGGELSRVMLALIVGQSDALRHVTLVFDELDTGVGGITANYMGRVLQTLGGSQQLIVVTHLPQIARCASHHFTIHKTTDNQQVCVTIQKIENDAVTAELQRMVGGDVVTSLIT